MKKLITLTLLIFLGYSTSFSQKKLKGKEIGIDLRNFNNNGNINFLIRKNTKDSLIKKRKNISFGFQSNSQFPDYFVTEVKANEIPNAYKSSTNNYTRLNFAWGKENYLRLEEINSKNLFFYHTLMKSIEISNQTTQNLTPYYINNTLDRVERSSNNDVSIGLGLSLLGGIKYNLSSKIALGIESGINGGVRMGTHENKRSQYSISDKLTTELNSSKNNSTSMFFNTNLINAIWFSYKF